MGRSSKPGQSRQARRAQERRQQSHQKARPLQHKGSNRWPLAILAAVIAIAALSVIIYASKAASNGTATPVANFTGTPVDGIGCDTMAPGYHVHAHLAIYENGKLWKFSQWTGHNINQDCLFWVHKHPDENGLIHIESPRPIKPTVKTFFDIAQKTAPGTVPSLTPKTGQQVKAWVNMKPYTGNPLNIVLLNHTDVTIEVGGPFHPPVKFNFAANGV